MPYNIIYCSGRVDCHLSKMADDLSSEGKSVADSVAKPVLEVTKGDLEASAGEDATIPRNGTWVTCVFHIITAVIGALGGMLWRSVLFGRWRPRLFFTAMHSRRGLCETLTHREAPSWHALNNCVIAFTLGSKYWCRCWSFVAALLSRQFRMGSWTARYANFCGHYVVHIPPTCVCVHYRWRSAKNLYEYVVLFRCALLSLKPSRHNTKAAAGRRASWGATKWR